MEHRNDSLPVNGGEDGQEHGHHRRAACFDDDLFLTLSCGGSSSSSSSSGEGAGMMPRPRRRRRRRRGQQAFECRTCGRRFNTFQALGGHRTSHLRRPATKKPTKPVVGHACATCGLGFSTGQALGGHMRKHRWAANAVDPGDYLGFTQVMVNGERPSRPASLQLLELFV